MIGVGEWPSTPGADTLALPAERENHVLDVYLQDNRPVDLRLDGESLFLANLEPWRGGEVLDLNESDGSQVAR